LTGEFQKAFLSKFGYGKLKFVGKHYVVVGEAIDFWIVTPTKNVGNWVQALALRAGVLTMNVSVII
jgi:hypothetical protein